ncbi:MAG: MerR family transcriptional regulator [Clostridia bacterium]|nr:MerR family transcriptional regulator [Clostridia bacterium]
MRNSEQGDTIARLSRRLGITNDTIRHYRETGLLHPSAGENGYYRYDTHDMLRILITREMRSMDISLKEAADFSEHRNVSDFTAFLAAREASLSEQMEKLTLALERIRETRVYAECALTLPGKVEAFTGPGTVAVCAIGPGLPHDRGRVLGPWADKLPFTYVSATIPLEELDRGAPGRAFSVTAGIGALEKYTGAFRLPVPEYAYRQPGGSFIRTCITTRDILAVTYEDLRILYEYRDAHGLRFAGCSGGRVLFLENTAEGPLYHLLVWVPVRPAAT